MEERSPLNILLLNDSFPPTIDGVANVMLNYAENLHACGDAVSVATPAYPDVTDAYPFPVYRYPSMPTGGSIGYRAGAPFSPELFRTLAGQRPQIIHTHCPVISGMLARMLAPQADAPVIFTYHTKFDIDIRKAIRGKRLQEAAVRVLVNNISAADEVWVVSEGAGENLRSLGYTGDCIVMENGVDFPRGKAPAQAVAAARQQWGIPEGLPVFLFVGRMMWYKGMRTSLEALRLAADAGQDFRFVLVGDGVDRPQIEALAAELGLAEKCIFTGAIRDREALRAVFGCADLFLFPSTFDTNGIVVREAAACFCASVLVAGSCAAEGITDGETGYLFDGTPQDMARILCAVCADPAAAHAVGENAAQRIYLSWQDAVARARARYEVVWENWRTGKLRRHAEVPGDDMYRHAGEWLTLLGVAGGETREEWQELREDWREAKEELRGDWNETKQGLREEWQQARRTAREDFADAKASAKENIAQAKENALEKLDDLRDGADDARRTVQQKLDDARSALRIRREAYLAYLKDQLAERLDDTREDWDALLDELGRLWRDDIEGPDE